MVFTQLASKAMNNDGLKAISLLSRSENFKKIWKCSGREDAGHCL